MSPTVIIEIKYKIPPRRRNTIDRCFLVVSKWIDGVQKLDTGPMHYIEGMIKETFLECYKHVSIWFDNMMCVPVLIYDRVLLGTTRQQCCRLTTS